MSTLSGARSSGVLTFHGVLPSDQYNNNNNKGDVSDGVVSGVSHTHISVLSDDVVWPSFVFFKGFKLGPPSTEVLTGIVVGPSNHWVGAGSISSRHFYRREDGSG